MARNDMLPVHLAPSLSDIVLFTALVLHFWPCHVGVVEPWVKRVTQTLNIMSGRSDGYGNR